VQSNGPPDIESDGDDDTPVDVSAAGDRVVTEDETLGCVAASVSLF
jgi:hypothetical protein